jgi:P27 family predicted phage terminase small subunit
MNLLGAADENALARYATTWVRWRNALKLIEKGGEMTVFKDERGNVKAVQPSAFHSVIRSLASELAQMEATFGMNPSARSRIEVAPRPVIKDANEISKSRFFDPPQPN